MPNIVGTSIISYSTWNSTQINGNYSFPSSGYVLGIGTRGGATPATGDVVISGSYMSVLSTMTHGTAPYAYLVKLYGLRVGAGTHSVLTTVAGISLHLIHFSNARGYRQVTTRSADKSPTITPTLGKGVAQLVFVTEGYGSVYTDGYTPPTGFTELSDTASIGSGSDWWHGTGTSYKINTGTSPLTLTYSFRNSDMWSAFCVELQPSGGLVMVNNEE